MNLALAVLQRCNPDWLKKVQLAELVDCTAAAFGGDSPSLEGLSFDECLEEYARFTVAEVEAAIRRGSDPVVLRDRLYGHAYALGRSLRARLRVSNADEAMEAIRLLYRSLRIQLDGPANGEIEVSECFFSRYYSSRVCQLVSALDSGIVAGLTGGGRLTFYQRMTEGCNCCRAIFEEGTT